MGLLSILDMHRLIEQDVQKLGFYVYDDLETEEIDLQINRQIYKLVDGILDKYYGRIPKLGADEKFQLNQVTLDNLKGLHIKDLDRTLETFDDGSKFSLPDDYYHLIKNKVKVTYKCGKDTLNKTVKLRVSETADIDLMRIHPFHKSTKESPLAEIVNNTVYIYTPPDVTLSSIKIDYIRKPVTVKYMKDIDGNFTSTGSIDCDLGDSLHYLVVDMTTLKILKIIESQQQKIDNVEKETI